MLMAVWSNTMNSLKPQAVSTQQYRSTETTSKTLLTLQIQTAPLQYKHSHAVAVTLVILCCPFQNQQRQFIHISTQKMLHDTMKTWTAYQLSTGIQVKLYKVHQLKKIKESMINITYLPLKISLLVWSVTSHLHTDKSTNLINCETNAVFMGNTS